MTVGGAFVYVCERDRVKDFVYITWSVITRGFFVDPDDRAIMELQCTKLIKQKLNTLTDVPYEMTVGGAFVYVCERDRGPRRPRYNGVAVYQAH